jgi:hypothetical protein
VLGSAAEKDPRRRGRPGRGGRGRGELEVWVGNKVVTQIIKERSEEEDDRKIKHK